MKSDDLLSAFYEGEYVPKARTEASDHELDSWQTRIEEKVFALNTQYNAECRQMLQTILALEQNKQAYHARRSYFQGLTYGIEFMMAILADQVPSLKRFATEHLLDELGREVKKKP